MPDAFWQAIDAQIALLEHATTAAQVIEICPHIPELSCSTNCSDPGHGFFEGGGGDKQVADALYTAGWKSVDVRASYHWCMQAPDGSMITYVEGDLYVGNGMPRREQV